MKMESKTMTDGTNQQRIDSFLPDALKPDFERLRLLLLRFGKAYNLTTIENEQDFRIDHVLDSLAARLILSGAKRIVDVGTGAGFPGLALAMSQPQRQFTLIDSRKKKTTFVRLAALELKLTNVTVECGRWEDIEFSQPIDAVCCRAVYSDETWLDRLAKRSWITDRSRVLWWRSDRDDISSLLPEKMKKIDSFGYHLPERGKRTIEIWKKG